MFEWDCSVGHRWGSIGGKHMQAVSCGQVRRGGLAPSQMLRCSCGQGRKGRLDAITDAQVQLWTREKRGA
eukprot:1151195-Pelagomonas_calceolata.AAC.9